MAVEELSQLPSSFTAGSTVKVRSSLSDFPVGSWVLEYSFQGPTNFKKTAAVDGSEWLLTLTETDTKDVRAGNYLWLSRVKNISTGETAMVGRGSVGISANPFVGQPKSAQRLLVEALEDTIKKLSAKTASSLSVNGKSYTLQDLPALYKMLRVARMDLDAEEGRDATLNGQRSRNEIQVTFTNPGYPQYSTEFPLYPGFRPNR